MNLIFRRLTSLLILLSAVSIATHAQATKEVVEVTEPGTLQKIVEGLESSRFESLTIKGGLDATDIAYLNSGKGPMAMIETLDLSDVTLVPGDKPYKDTRTTWGRSASVYYISDKYHVETEYVYNPLGFTTEVKHIFSNALSGAFSSNEAFQKIILPQSLPNVGDLILSGATVKEVVMPASAQAIGDDAFSGCKNLEKIQFPINLVSIGAGAFGGTETIEPINIPASVRTIGDGAFSNTNLTKINLENVKSIGMSAFDGAKVLDGNINLGSIDTIPACAIQVKNLSSVIFSPTLKRIEERAFSYTELKEIEFPSSLEYIGERAFYECRNLTDVKIPMSIKQIGNGAFDYTPWGNTLTSENGIVYIANVAYQYDTKHKHTGDSFSFREGTVAISNGFNFSNEVRESVRTVQLPESLLEIGDEVFKGFKVLGEVKLPSSLQRIGNGAFRDCPKFWCTLPENLISIGEMAFESCTTLSKVTLPENLRHIGGAAFSNTSVGTLHFYSKNLEIKDFSYVYTYKYSPFGEYSSLKKVIIGPNVTRLDDMMFPSTKTLTTIEFEDVENSKLEYVGDWCFRWCGDYVNNNNTKIEKLPTSIKHIGNSAFMCLRIDCEPNLENVRYLGEMAFFECRGFETISIPESVDTIGGDAFAYCKDLRRVEFNAINVTTTYNHRSIFYFCDSLKEAVIGPKVKFIPDNMFSTCRNVEKVIFKSRETGSRSSETPGYNKLQIGNGAFCYLDKLTSIELPEGTDSIGADAFSRTSLTTINIPSTCSFLGKDVFYGTPLQSIYFNSIEPPVFGGRLDDRDWNYAQNLTIYVPEESYDLYKNQDVLWKYPVVAVPSSGIDDIITDQNLKITVVYDVNGMIANDRWTNGDKGIYIIKMSDGSVRKVIR